MSGANIARVGSCKQRFQRQAQKLSELSVLAIISRAPFAAASATVPNNRNPQDRRQ